MLLSFDSLGDFARFADSRVTDYRRENSGSFYGGMTWQEAVSSCYSGDLSLVAAAEALLDKIDASVEVERRLWSPSLYGAFPSVPDFLAGAPDCMRRLRPDPSDVSPVNIYVSTTSSAGISAETMLKRGVAIIALLLKLQQVRPVSLSLLAELHGQSDGACIECIRLESSPIDLSTACFAICRVGFARHLTYGVAQVMDRFNGGWPNGYRSEHWATEIRQRVGMVEQDLYIPAATAWDPIITDPVAWVNAQVAKYGTETEGL